ncbi:hypothetical protein FMG_P0050 (plasmid) [Finegoldia magna ATCC 29328]|uniref:DpnD/PcfM-like C-terminal domain-containing protein n=2 Tax=Finegoldia magna TaxID=1260 RepID=B0S4A8_FINM2|nr:hypothetical protein FMG_P0050 [Finegoldia magna ATCC 29328]
MLFSLVTPIFYIHKKTANKGEIIMKYNVEIVETLRKVVEIEAKTEEEAIRKVEEMYFNEDIVLDSDDFDNLVEFNLQDD